MQQHAFGAYLQRGFDCPVLSMGLVCPLLQLPRERLTHLRRGGGFESYAGQFLSRLCPRDGML
jgi:hypothetical protein